MRVLILTPLLMIAASATAGLVPDNLIYRQPPSPGPGFVSSTRPGGALLHPDARTADSLLIPIPARVYRIDWWGGDEVEPLFAPPLWNIESFNIRIYGDFAPDTPMTLLAEHNVGIDDLDIVETGGTAGEFGGPEFRFSFRSDTELFDGLAMWISIAAEYVAPPSADRPAFVWSGSSEFDNFLAQDRFDGEGFGLVFGERTNAAYALYGFVPAPGAASLLALAGITASRRQR